MKQFLSIVIIPFLLSFWTMQVFMGLQDAPYTLDYGWASVLGHNCASKWKRYEYVSPFYRLGCYLGGEFK